MSSSPRHPNARLIENLYAAIQKADPTAITACYADDAYFEDIAFRLRGRERIMEMWRLVCHSRPEVTFDLNSISANEHKGSGRWRAKYCYGKTDSEPGRRIDNTLTSEFDFGAAASSATATAVTPWPGRARHFPSRKASSQARSHHCGGGLPRKNSRSSRRSRGTDTARLYLHHRRED
jgi:hypothetical protein